jgi:NAD/NADP transhydrogenase alpha subunit
MLILICKDSATQVPREVASVEEAQAFAAQGFEVLVQLEDGSKKPLSELLSTAVDAAIAAVEAHVGLPPVVTRKKKA